MGRRSLAVVLMTAAACAGALPPIQGEVIAGPTAIDQPEAAMSEGVQFDAADAEVHVPTPMHPVEPGDRLNMASAFMAVAAMAILILVLARGGGRLGARRWPMVVSPPVALLMVIGFLILGQIGLALAAKVSDVEVAVARRTIPDQVRLVAGAYAGQALVLMAYLWMHVKARRRVQAGGEEASGQRAMPLGRSLLLAAGVLAVIWPIVMAVAAAVGYVQARVTGEAVDVIAHESLRLFLESELDGWYVMFAAIILFVTPVMEEVMYRGLVQRSLVHVGMGPWMAIGSTSAMFALMHSSIASPHALAGLVVLSFGFGWLYEKTGRLTAVIAMHAAFNAGNLGLAVLIGSKA